MSQPPKKKPRYNFYASMQDHYGWSSAQTSEVDKTINKSPVPVLEHIGQSRSDDAETQGMRISEPEDDVEEEHNVQEREEVSVEQTQVIPEDTEERNNEPEQVQRSGELDNEDDEKKIIEDIANKTADSANMQTGQNQPSKFRWSEKKRKRAVEECIKVDLFNEKNIKIIDRKQFFDNISQLLVSESTEFVGLDAGKVAKEVYKVQRNATKLGMSNLHAKDREPTHTDIKPRDDTSELAMYEYLQQFKYVVHTVALKHDQDAIVLDERRKKIQEENIDQARQAMAEKRQKDEAKKKNQQAQSKFFESGAQRNEAQRRVASVKEKQYLNKTRAKVITSARALWKDGTIPEQFGWSTAEFQGVVRAIDGVEHHLYDSLCTLAECLASDNSLACLETEIEAMFNAHMDHTASSD